MQALLAKGERWWLSNRIWDTRILAIQIDN